MSYLLALAVLGTLGYAAWCFVRAQAARPKTRVIGPDDDPEFLSRLGHGDNNPTG